MAILLWLILLFAVIVAGLVWFTANTAKRVEALLPPRGQFMDIDGQHIHYVDTGGTKPAIVMIHGLGGNLLHFSYAMADKLDRQVVKHKEKSFDHNHDALKHQNTEL